jgi:hypothetical protein
LFFARDAFEEEGGGFMKKKRGDAKTKVSKKEKLSKKLERFLFSREKLLFFKPKTDQKPREKSA